MTEKHTPGPWEIGADPDDIKGYFSIWVEKSAGVQLELAGRISVEGDAHLLASAPDLLKTLKKAVINFKDFLDPDGEFEFSDTASRSNIREWEAAIAKAERRDTV